MYAVLVNCDPFTSGAVKKIDQVMTETIGYNFLKTNRSFEFQTRRKVLPYFVMKIGSAVPGLPGLFIAGIFSGALSSLSGLLNTISCIVYEDFLHKS